MFILLYITIPFTGHLCPNNEIAIFSINQVFRVVKFFWFQFLYYNVKEVKWFCGLFWRDFLRNKRIKTKIMNLK